MNNIQLKNYKKIFFKTSKNFWNQCAPTKNMRNYRQGDAVTGDDVPMTSTPYQKLQIFF